MHVSVWECVYQYLHKQRLEQPKLGAVSIYLPQMWPPQHFILPAVSVKHRGRLGWRSLSVWNLCVTPDPEVLGMCSTN